MNRTEEPEWSALPDEILSTDVAKIFGIRPGTLSEYVRRGKIAAPATHNANKAWYRKTDVQAYWNRKKNKVEYWNAPPAIPIGDTSLAPHSPPTAATETMLESLPDALAERLKEAFQAAIEEGTKPLLLEVKTLREEVGALRSELVAAREQMPVTPATEKQPPTLPPIILWWRRLTGRENPV